MRVLFVTNTFPPDYTGGAEVSLYHTCRGLMEAGQACRVLHVNHRREARDDLWYEVDGIPVHRVQFNTRWPWHDILDPRITHTVAAEIADFRPDLLHVHNVSGASLAPFVAGGRAGVPVVNTLHDHWLLCPNNMLYRADGSLCDPASPDRPCGRCLRQYDYWAAVPHRQALFARLTAGVARFISPSQSLIAAHVAAGFDPARFRHLPHGLAETPAATELDAPIAAALAAAAGHPTILFAGGGVAIKGAETVLVAIPQIMAHIDDVHLLIAGGGDPQRLLAFRRWPAHVHVLGAVPFTQMHALYAAADLVLMPSVVPESFSLVVYEGFQHGAPAVGAEIGAIPELIGLDDQAHVHGAGPRGYLFPRGDAAALAERVIHHFARPAVERRRLRHTCLAHVRTRLSLAAHIAGLFTIYSEALA